MRQETYDQEMNLVEYIEVSLVNGEYITDDNGIIRSSNESEINDYKAYENKIKEEEEQANAQAVVEEAKNSDNPEIASLAEAFSKLLQK